MYKDLEERKQYHKEYYKKNRERSLSTSKKWQLENQEYVREYRKKYWQKRKAELSEYFKQYYQDNKEWMIEYAKEWYKGKRNHVSMYRKERNLKIKLNTLTHYGNGKCACVKCGENRLACLSLDHIDGNGAEHRREIGRTAIALYFWLIKNDFPEGYQTLCMNCQFVKKVFHNEYSAKTKNSK